jgi:hypothetical protein
MTGSVVADRKYLALGDRAFKVHGTTYGGFVPRLDSAPFPDRARVKEDFRLMAEAGLNTMRTYTLPSVDVLDLADESALRLIILDAVPGVHSV